MRADLVVPGEGEENIEYAMYDISFLNIGENVALKWSYNGSDYELLDSDCTNHVIWATGGSLMPKEEREKLLNK